MVLNYKVSKELNKNLFAKPVAIGISLKEAFSLLDKILDAKRTWDKTLL